MQSGSSYGAQEIKPLEGEKTVFWVIIGGGPSGLLLALLLDKIKAGKITLVDPEFGNYFRSGDYVNEVFLKIANILNVSIEELLPSYANHIKDVEIKLSELINKTGTIEVVKGKFTTYSGHHVYVERTLDETKDDKRPENCILPFNVLIDCSGQTAAVVNEVNRLHPDKPIFTRTQIHNDAPRRYVHATIVMQRGMYMKYLNALDSYEPNKDTLATFRNKEALQKFEWQYWANPFAYINRFEKFGLDPLRKPPTYPTTEYLNKTIKCHFYSEVPEGLTEEQIIPWIQTNITAKTGIEAVEIELTHPSKKPRKRSCQFFNVIPKITMPSYFVDSGDASSIFCHIGDSSFNNHFQAGVGLQCALNQISKFVSFISINENGMVTIDLTSYAKWAKENLKPYVKEVEIFFMQRKIQLESTNAQLKLIRIAYNEVLEFLNASTKDNFFDDENIERLQIITDQNLEKLKLCWDWTPTGAEIEGELQEAIVCMALHCKALADYLSKQHGSDYEGTLKYYNAALKLYSHYVLGGNAEAVADLSSTISAIEKGEQPQEAQVPVQESENTDDSEEKVEINDKRIKRKINFSFNKSSLSQKTPNDTEDKQPQNDQMVSKKFKSNI